MGITAEFVRENPSIRGLLKTSEYWPHEPTEKQTAFLIPVWVPEILFGGATGGGKSDALLMAALQYVDVSGYRALILRRTFRRLAMPGEGLIPRSFEWLGETDAVWSGDNYSWTFPSGAILTFGHMQHVEDMYNYQGGAYQFIGFDEITEFTQEQYEYMFSRQRRSVDSKIPLRFRSTANPIGAGKEWVRRHFVDAPDSRERMFIPSLLEDNPHLDQVSYDARLRRLGSLMYAALRHGNWDVEPEGTKFKREWFRQVDSAPERLKVVRWWDLAATDEPRAKPGRARPDPADPDWTVGLLMGRTPEGAVYVLDVVRFRLSEGEQERQIVATAEADSQRFGRWTEYGESIPVRGAVPIRMEQEPGASGKIVVGYYRRRVLPGYDFRGIPSSGDKEVRANPFASTAEVDGVSILRGDWNNDYVDEMAAFPQGAHDDQVDASSGAFAYLTGRVRGGQMPRPQGVPKQDARRRSSISAGALRGR